MSFPAPPIAPSLQLAAYLTWPPSWASEGMTYQTVSAPSSDSASLSGDWICGLGTLVRQRLSLRRLDLQRGRTGENLSQNVRGKMGWGSEAIGGVIGMELNLICNATKALSEWKQKARTQKTRNKINYAHNVHHDAALMHTPPLPLL